MNRFLQEKLFERLAQKSFFTSNIRGVIVLYSLFFSFSPINTFLCVIDALGNLKFSSSAGSLDFKGKPLEGLQIMGMLESRVLDFETVIISSVNEGILPSGKTQNSFIPFDVKLENNLPTYKEKDAIYTYHFYRLIPPKRE